MTTVAADATALVAASAVPDSNAVAAPVVGSVAPRDWTRTVGIMSIQGSGQDNNRYGDLALRLVSRGDTGKVVGLKLGVLALAVTGRAYVPARRGYAVTPNTTASGCPPAASAAAPSSPQSVE
jgi:hypothetical protein